MVDVRDQGAVAGDPQVVQDGRAVRCAGERLEQSRGAPLPRRTDPDGAGVRGPAGVATRDAARTTEDPRRRAGHDSAPETRLNTNTTSSPSPTRATGTAPGPRT